MRWLKNSCNQRGVASLIITIVLIALMSTIAVGFAIVMNRELNESVQNQIGQAAYDAAESGINDAISYMRDNPNTNVTQCQGLIGPGKALNAASVLSADGSTKYTCLLINTTPPSLVYQAIPTGQSQVVKVTTSLPISKMMVSWQASDRSQANFIPTGELNSLLDQTTWHIGKYTPLLQLSLYPVPADTLDASFANTNNRTYFLYPGQATGNTVTSMSYSAVSGTLQPVSCGTTATNGTFSPTPTYDCNVIVSDLPSTDPSGYVYYLRLSPIYGAADVEVQADDTSGNPVNFLDTQAIVDVTAQSATAVKRLQARVDISGLDGTSQDITPGDNTFPQYAVQTPDAICKRVQVPTYGNGAPVYIDDNSLSYCGLPNLAKLEPPIVNAERGSSPDPSDATFDGNVNPNNGTLSDCYFQYSTNQGSLGPTDTDQHYNCVDGNGNSVVGDSGNTVTEVSANISGLSGGTTYYFQICATNQAGTKCDPGDGNSTGVVTTQSPPPSLTDFYWPGNSIPSNDPNSPTDTCESRYGYPSAPDNCFSYDGSNLQSCDVYLNGTDSLTTDQGPNGGPFTLGNGQPDASTTYIVCSGITCYLGAACQEAPPIAPPPPNQTQVEVFYYAYDHQEYSKQENCHDGLHDYVLCVYWNTTPDLTCQIYVNGSLVESLRTGSDGNNPSTPYSGWTSQGVVLGYDQDPQRLNSPTVYVTCPGASDDPNGDQQTPKNCGQNYIANSDKNGGSGNQCPYLEHFH